MPPSPSSVQATIARTDRNCPEYHDNYEDENTFYAGGVGPAVVSKHLLAGSASRPGDEKVRIVRNERNESERIERGNPIRPWFFGGAN